jgi:oxygen-independent coproporphyrinogen-3 oxidase
VGHTFTQNCRELGAWEDEIDAGRVPVFRGYVQTRDDVIRSAVIEECLCSGRISKNVTAEKYRIDFDAYFAKELDLMQEMERDGLVNGRLSRVIRVTQAGRIFVRTIAQVFDAFQPAAVASKAV